MLPPYLPNNRNRCFGYVPGALLTEIIDNMARKRSHTLTPDRSVFVYSAHDVTQLNLMRALSIVEHTTGKPAYASAIVLETHHSSAFDDDFEVKVSVLSSRFVPNSRY